MTIRLRQASAAAISALLLVGLTSTGAASTTETGATSVGSGSEVTATEAKEPGSTPPKELTAAGSETAPTEWEEAARLTMQDVPGLSHEQAMDRVKGQTGRIAILEELAQSYPDAFGGAWFDYVENVQHIVTSSDQASEAALNLSEEHGIEIALHYAERSYQELLTIAQSLNAGNVEGVPPIDDALGAVTIDVETNRVELAVYDLVLADVIAAAATAALGPAINVAFDSSPHKPGADDACYTRYSCGAPIRSGTVIDPSNCSLGYIFAGQTAKWVVTAGHCEPLIDRVMFVGEQYVGPVRQTANINSMDIARARLDNPYWANQSPGGWQYNAWAPESPRTIDYAIVAASTIEMHDQVCLNARFSEIHLSCGRITEPYLNYRVRVDFDACGGDSGGAWTWNTGAGEYWAYGVHESSLAGTCHDPDGFSDFFSVPAINVFWDFTTTETLRVMVR